MTHRLPYVGIIGNLHDSRYELTKAFFSDIPYTVVNSSGSSGKFIPSFSVSGVSLFLTGKSGLPIPVDVIRTHTQPDTSNADTEAVADSHLWVFLTELEMTTCMVTVGLVYYK